MVTLYTKYDENRQMQKKLSVAGPLVSVIIPVYNMDKYLERCFRTIQNQTYSNLEIILVNDGSTDSSPSLCDEYEKQDKRVRVIHKENQGLGEARNSGINVARGEWLCFVDSDDFVARQFVEILLGAAIKYNCITAQCKSIMGTKDKIQDITSPPNVNTLNWKDYIYQCKQGYGHSLFAIWANIYHKSIFNTLRFGKYRNGEDMPMLPQYVWANRDKSFALVDCIMYYYYQRYGSILNSVDNISLFDRIAASESMVDFWQDKEEDDLFSYYKSLYFHDLLIIYLVLTRDNIPGWDKDEVIEKIRKDFEWGKQYCGHLFYFPKGIETLWDELTKIRNIVVLKSKYQNLRLLSWIKYFGFNITEIWDIGANETNYIEGVRMCLPHNGLDKNVCIFNIIENNNLGASISKQLRAVGYTGIIDEQTLQFATKYASYKEFLPWLLH